MGDYKASIENMSQCISKDKEKPTTRRELSTMLGLCDRECRIVREKALLQGIPVITSSQFSGAYISHDPEDIAMVKREAYSRAMKELKKVRACKRILERIGQERIDDGTID